MSRNKKEIRYNLSDKVIENKELSNFEKETNYMFELDKNKKITDIRIRINSYLHDTPSWPTSPYYNNFSK